MPRLTKLLGLRASIEDTDLEKLRKMDRAEDEMVSSINDAISKYSKVLEALGYMPVDYDHKMHRPGLSEYGTPAPGEEMFDDPPASGEQA